MRSVQRFRQPLPHICVFSWKLLKGAWLLGDEDSLAKYASSSPPFVNELCAFQASLWNYGVKLSTIPGRNCYSPRMRKPRHREAGHLPKVSRKANSQRLGHWAPRHFLSLQGDRPQGLSSLTFCTAQGAFPESWGGIISLGNDSCHRHWTWTGASLQTDGFLLYDGVKVYPCGHSVLTFLAQYSIKYMKYLKAEYKTVVLGHAANL